jgi:hypothetical protein
MTTALAIEALLSDNVKIKFVAASLIYNITLEIGNDRTELGVEWACEVLAACAQAKDVDVKVVYALGLGLKAFWDDEAVVGLARVMDVRDGVKEAGDVGKEICELIGEGE